MIPSPELARSVAALAAALSPERWPARVRAWCETEAAQAGPWCVALSGGADSVALLLTLVGMRKAETQAGGGGAALQPAPSDAAEVEQCGLKHRAMCQTETRNPKPETRKGRRLVALHFNHRLRGAAADGDEAFCRELCGRLGVEFRVGAAMWPAGSEVSEA
ncbi:MAG TPA: hypothetical protein VK163_09515, partial [Opitutaceae bacterium]|nr:hypothetical protein [Opitutaceae bacterium]